MSIRNMAPITVVILLVGLVMVSTALGIVTLAIIATMRDVEVVIPQELATVCISSLTALGGLLTPSTGIMSNSRAVRRAEVAGHAAAAAVVEAEQHDAAEAEGHELGRHR